MNSRHSVMVEKDLNPPGLAGEGQGRSKGSADLSIGRAMLSRYAVGFIALYCLSCSGCDDQYVRSRRAAARQEA